MEKVMASNSALLVRIYPNSRQESLLKRACYFRYHYYLSLALWWNSTQDTCCKLYKEFCESESDESIRKEFSKTLPWPPKKVTKEGLNDTCLKVIYDLVPTRIKFACVRNFTDKVKKGKDKGQEKNYGDLFRLNAIFLPTVYGNRIVDSSSASWCKDNFAQAVTKTFKDKKGTSVRFPKFKEANTFKISIKELEMKKDSKGRVTKILVPFLSGEYRNKLGKEIEWFRCSLSDSQLQKIQSASAMTITCNSYNQWHCAVSVYKESSYREETGLECGIDLGIKTTAEVASNSIGEKSVEYDKFESYSLPVQKIKELESKIEYLQKIQMRRIKTWLRLNQDGIAKDLKMNTAKNDRSHNAVFVYRKHYQSKSYKETELRIAGLNNRIANIRKDFSEQFSRKIVNKYDSIGMEDLNVKGMAKNPKLARAINRIGFYKLRVALERKALKVSILNRFAPSSQVCSCCGYRNHKVKSLAIREWVCPQCGKHHDRDQNAASNIRPSRHNDLPIRNIEKQ